MTPDAFLKWEGKAPGIDFKVQYVDVAGGDVEAGLLLSQVLYWCLPSKKSGKTKLTVRRAGNVWIAKTKKEWHQETRLKRRRFNSALQVLEKLELVTVRTFHFRNLPHLHIALNLDTFLYRMESVLEAEAEATER